MKKIAAILAMTIMSVSGFTVKGYQTEGDISYTNKEDGYSKERLTLDVYYDSPGERQPVIVWFHGGGLTGGNKHIPSELTESGCVVVAPNYRLIPNVGVAECIDDAAEAVAWVFKNIDKYGGDASKIFVAGHSAGGFLTSMIGLDKGYLEKYGVEADSIAALFPFSGQCITHFSDRESKGIGALTPFIDDHAPLYHVRKDCPPYIIITGDAEQELFGRYEENLYMWRMMKLVGHPHVKIFKLDGYNHGDMASPAHHIMKGEIKKLLSESE